MIEFAESPVVLSAAREGLDLVLRVDTNLWNMDVSRTDSVRVLSIHHAHLADRDEPSTWVGHHVELNEYTEGDVHVVELYINYAVDYVEVRSQGTSQDVAPYSLDDLAAKLRALAGVAGQYATQAAEAEREIQRVRREIGARVRRELDVGERKRQFFATSHPDRARAIESELKFLRDLNEKLERGSAT
jgi:hypothetical protein